MSASSRTHRFARASIKALLPLLSVVGTTASAQIGASNPTERVISDTSGGWTEHYSISQRGPLYNPQEFVTVGARELPGLGHGLHIVRYDAAQTILGESLYLPPGSADIVGYSVEVLANGDLLIAGEVDDQYSGTGLLNTFVALMSDDASVVYWAKLLPGTLNRRPSVTARQMNDGTYVIVHNEWPDYGGDLGPTYGRITRLDMNGNWIWSTRLAVPNAPLGQLGFLDVRQEPGANGSLWVAGWCSPLFGRDALLLNIDPISGCPLGEGGWKYPHPDFEQTWFTALQMDRRPDGSFTMVAAGGATGLDITDIPRPRVLEAPAFGGGAAWDHVFDVFMSPAPTALVVTRGSINSGPVPITVAGTFNQWLSQDEVARILKFSTNDPGAAQAWGFGDGSPPDTRFNDLTEGQVVVGGYEIDPGPTDLYIVGRGVSSCAERMPAPDLGPGTLGFVYPDCFEDQLIVDLPLMDVGSQSATDIICTYRQPPIINTTRWP